MLRILCLSSTRPTRPNYIRAALRLTRNSPITSSTVIDSNTTARRTMAHFDKPSGDRPKHEMVYFPDMHGSLPSQSADFRRVLWTGLYSQLVLMNVPVGGEIGEEVCIALKIDDGCRH